MRPSWSLCTGRALTALFVASFVVPSAPRALVPVTRADQQLEVLPRQAPLAPMRALERQAALQQSAPWRAWAAQHPYWRVQWNLRTGTPHRMSGPGVRLPLVPTAATIERACRVFLARYPVLTGVADADLALVSAVQRNGLWFVLFEQRAQGLPVRGGRVDLRIGAAGQVAMVGSDCFPHVSVAATPQIEAGAALAIAAEGIGSLPTEAQSALVVAPEPQGEEFAYRLAWELQFRTASPAGAWLARVDARTGELLERESHTRWAQLTGTITAAIESVTVGDAWLARPLPDTRFEVGAGTIEFGYTDASGQYDVATTATDSVTVQTHLAGLYARIYDYQQQFATPSSNARVLPGTTHDFAWDESNSKASERDAYYHTVLAHQIVKQLDPALTGIDYQMPIVVDNDTHVCDANYDGFGLNFFAAGGGCVDAARIADVVFHEYAHAVTDRLYRPLAAPAAMDEGFSDYRAASGTGQPRIGRGLYGPGTFLRTVDNTNRYPDDVSGEPHHDGLILAGALWDLRTTLGRARADTLQHYACYGRATSFDDYLLDVLACDDDNGDLYDGTPHFDAIVAAFSAHGIGDYRVQVVHTPLTDTEDVAKPLRVQATILSLFPLDAARLELHYAVDGGPWSVLPLVATGEQTHSYAATIPTPPADADVSYFLTAADVENHTALLPPAGESAPFQFHFGSDTTPPSITHTPLADQPLDAPGWSVEAAATDNLDRGLAAVRVEWSRNTPALDQQLPLVPAGLPLWSGALSPAGASWGDSIYYRIVAIDSASVPNVAHAPVAGHFRFRIVHGFARDFEASSGALGASGDWQWGVPAAGPAATSGTNVWGTGLSGTYANDRHSYLETAAVDLSGWAHAALYFQQFVDTEPQFDGGNVQVTTDDGAHWSTLTPNGGYPVADVQALAEPGWSGSAGHWERAAVDLSGFTGQTIRLRWHFAADAGVTARGWFVDDLALVESQLLSVPLHLRARDGLDAEVGLQWDAPAGVDPSLPGTPLLGYHVYRGVLPDLSDAVRRTTTPLPVPAYTDPGVVNGSTYYYAVTALYAGGESSRSAPVAAHPFRAGYACDASSLYVWVPMGGASDTTLTFTNTGTGSLRLNVWLGDWFDTSVQQVRVAYDVQSGVRAADAPVPARSGRFEAALAALHARPQRALHRWTNVTAHDEPAWQLLHTDAREDGSPDFARLYAAEGGGLVLFKVTGWQPWGDPLADFNTVFGFDTDADRSTGDAHGDDLYLLVGPHVVSEVGAPAVIVTPDQEILGVPPYQLFPSGADSLAVGLPAGLLGGAGQRVFVHVRALGTDMLTLLDGMPSARDISTWMVPQVLGLAVPAGSPTPLVLAFPGTTSPGHHVGRLFVETNAPDAPVVTLPVTYDFATTPVTIQDFVAVQEEGDVVLRWRTADERDVRAFRLFRGTEGGPSTALSPDMPPAGAHSYQFRDRDPQPGHYVYRVGEVDGGGRVTLHASVAVTVVPRLPATTFLERPAPNPFNPSTTLRFGLAVPGSVEIAVFDARGRRVRTLVRETRLAAGFARVVWDGRDDAGARVASGVYTAQLRAGGRRWTQRLTLVK